MPGTRLARGGSKHTGLAVLLILLIVFTVGLVGVSPVALDLFQGDSKSWERSSLIGQTYGAASALLSAFALIGIAATLILQARDIKVNREQGRQVLHVDLMKMALENPRYLRAWGPVGTSDDPDDVHQTIYVNLIVSFEIKLMDERLLRLVTSNLFQGEAGRKFWAVARQDRLSTSGTRRERRFHEIVDDEYHAAQEQGPPRPDPEPRRGTLTTRHRELLAGALLGGIGVIVVDQLRRAATKHESGGG